MLTFLKSPPKGKTPVAQYESRIYLYGCLSFIDDRWDGHEIQSAIDAAGFTIFYYSDFKRKMERSQELERDLEQKEKEKLSFLSSGAQAIITGLLFIFKFVFEEGQQKHLSDYKMALSDYIQHNGASLHDITL